MIVYWNTWPFQNLKNISNRFFDQYYTYLVICDIFPINKNSFQNEHRFDLMLSVYTVIASLQPSRIKQIYFSSLIIHE